MHTTTTTDRLLKRSTHRPFAEICEAMASACQEQGFGVIGSVDLKAKMNAKNVPFERECTVFEVCNPQKAQHVLTRDMDIASALPCRLAVYVEGDRTVLSTLKPTILLELFEAPEIGHEAAEVEQTMRAIIDRLCD